MFKNLQEFLLIEADDEDIVGGALKIVDPFKKGWSDAAGRFDKKVADIKDNKKKVGEASLKAVKADLDRFIDEFFEKFPYDAAGPDETILKKYQDRATLKVAVTAFNEIAKRIKELRDVFNRSLLTLGISKTDIEEFERHDNITRPPEQLIKFVQKEAAFFKDLFKVDDDFELNNTAFKQLLAAKVSKTPKDRQPDAALALNLLFAYMIAQFKEYANVISTAGRNLPVSEDASGAADRAAQKVKDAEKDRKEQEREAAKKHKEAERAAQKAVDAEEKIKDKAAKAAVAAIKSSAADHKASTVEAEQELRDNLEKFTEAMITSFPFDGAMSAEDVLNKFPTREACVTAFKAYRGISDRLDQLITGMNRSLISTNKVRDEQIKRYLVQSQRMLKGGNPAVPGALVRFVKTEAKFLRQLIKIDDDLKLDDNEFKDRLAVKMNQTDAARIPDAAQALNLLFGYVSAKYRQTARTIAEVGRNLDDENAVIKKSARDAAAATAAAEVETRAKTRGR